jgi:two-component sensor histidine kinase
MATPEVPRQIERDACLVATELVSNSVKHGAGPIELEVRFGPGRPLRIEVSDEGGGFERELPQAPPAHGETSGWGLYLVDRLSDRWGADSHGRTTWAEIEPSQRPPGAG